MKKRAFTLVEISIALMIIAFITLLSLNSFSKLNPRVDKLKFKNANISFKHAVAALLDSSFFYSEDSGFTDLDDVQFEDKYTNQGLRYGGKEKFRNLLLRELGAQTSSNSFNCYMLTNSTHPELNNICYRSDNGVIWAIPNTDFVNSGVIRQENLTGGTSAYVPVTIYTNNSNIDSKNGFYHNAVVIGVRADGAMSLIDLKIDCNPKDKKNYAQCDVADTFASLNNTNMDK